MDYLWMKLSTGFWKGKIWLGFSFSTQLSYYWLGMAIQSGFSEQYTSINVRNWYSLWLQSNKKLFHCVWNLHLWCELQCPLYINITLLVTMTVETSQHTSQTSEESLFVLECEKSKFAWNLSIFTNVSWSILVCFKFASIC